VYSSIVEKMAIILTDVTSNLPAAINMPFNFCREEEWLSTFEKLDLEVVSKQAQKVPWFDLFQRVLFVLAPR